MIQTHRLSRIVVMISVLSAAVPALGQSLLSSSASPWAANIVVPQSRVLSSHHSAAVQVSEVTAGVVILEQVATSRGPTGRARAAGSRAPGLHL